MTTRPPVIFNRALYGSEDPHDRIQACVDYVNAMLGAMYLPEEVPHWTLVSYYTDYYLTQVMNGGISQFIYNSKWDRFIVACVSEGLEAMGATAQRDLFGRTVKAVSALGPRLGAFLRSEYFGDNALRDLLDKGTDEFLAIERQGSGLAVLNASFIASHPEIQVLEGDDHATLMKAATDMDDTRRARLREAEAAEEAGRSPPERAVRTWAARTAKPFECITVFDQEVWKGETVPAIHFRAGGSHYRGLLFGRVILIVDDGNQVIGQQAMEEDAAKRVPAASAAVSPLKRRAGAYRPQSTGSSSGIPSWLVIVIVILAMAGCRIVLRAFSHH